jgi:CubicO group peptidase (beta-lactamase class C family)
LVRNSSIVLWRFPTLTIATAVVLSASPLFAAQNAQPEIVTSEPSPDQITAIVSQAAESYFKDSPHAAGLSIGLLKDGHSYLYNFGKVRQGEKGAPSSDTIFAIASISKTFTGTLLAQAVLEKRVRFDEDVRKYLDGAYPNLEFEGHPIELQFLVNHNSGLPFNLPDIPENRPPFSAPVSSTIRQTLNNYSRQDFLRDLHAVQIKTVPGQKFSYSNAAAVLLSIVLERVYQMPYEEIVKRKIAGPLGMQDTTISLSDAQRVRLAQGYDENGAVVGYPPEIMLGAAGLKSTAADLLKYAGWELAEQDPAVKLSHQPRFVLTENYSVGLNWQIIKSEANRRIWQDGSTPGFLSICMTFPELHMAVVVLSNEDDAASSHAFDGIANRIAKSLDPRSVPLF